MFTSNRIRLTLETSASTIMWSEQDPAALSVDTFFAYLVTLAYGDQDEPTLAQVVFISNQDREDVATVARGLLQNARGDRTQIPRFDWSTLRVQGTQTVSDDELTQLIDACSKGQVGVGRVSKLRLSSD